MSQADLAEALGVTPAMVTRWKARGMPVDAGLEACQRWRRENVRSRVPIGGRQPVGEGAYAARPQRGEDYQEARTRREVAEANRAELELAELRGELVRAADVRAAYARRLAAMRETILQLPPRLASVMAAETDQARCHDLLQAELHAALEQMNEAA